MLPGGGGGFVDLIPSPSESINHRSTWTAWSIPFSFFLFLFHLLLLSGQIWSTKIWKQIAVSVCDYRFNFQEKRAGISESFDVALVDTWLSSMVTERLDRRKTKSVVLSTSLSLWPSLSVWPEFGLSKIVLASIIITIHSKTRPEHQRANDILGGRWSIC